MHDVADCVHDSGGVTVVGVVVGIRGIEGVPSLCICIRLEVGVSSLVIIGHGCWGTGGDRGWDIGTFVWEFKGGWAVMWTGEAVDFGWFYWFPWVVVWGRGSGVR